VSIRADLDLPVEVREVAEALVGALATDLRALLWHGSWARGEAGPTSDHDMIVVLRRMDEDIARRMREVFRGRANWSSFVQTEAELRQFPVDGRLQFHYGLVPLYGEFDPPSFTRENLVNDLRALARDIRFESRYRLLHKQHAYSHMDSQLASFQKTRNITMLGYAAKWAVLAMKTRELLEARDYPPTRKALRQRVSDDRELEILEITDCWADAKARYYDDPEPLAHLLDGFARDIVAWLESGGDK